MADLSFVGTGNIEQAEASVTGGQLEMMGETDSHERAAEMSCLSQLPAGLVGDVPAQRGSNLGGKSIVPRPARCDEATSWRRRDRYRVELATYERFAGPAVRDRRPLKGLPVQSDASRAPAATKAKQCSRAGKEFSVANEVGGTRPHSSQPWLHQRGDEIQHFGTVRQLPLGLSADARRYSSQRLNQVLCDTQILYALYKKHHWLMRGATFYQLHLLLDKHASEQLALVDLLAERVQTLGGVAVGDPRHVAEITKIPRPPNGVEEVPAMVSRLLEAHEIILVDAHEAAREVAELGDDGTNDILVSDVIRTGELEAWFLAEHLVDTPLVHT